MTIETTKSNDFAKQRKEKSNQGKSKYLSADNEFYPQNKGEISDSITQNWTEQALECYRLQCNCSICSISKGEYSFACQMPKILEMLITASGRPVTVESQQYPKWV